MAKNKDNADNAATDAPAVELAWGEYRVAFDALPQESIRILAQRGFTHILGNEGASKKSGKKPLTDAELVTWRHDKIAAMIGGTMTLRAVNTGMTSIDAEMVRLAELELIGIIDSKKVARPNKTRLKEMAKARAEGDNGPRLRVEATANLAANKGLKAIAADDLDDLINAIT